MKTNRTPYQHWAIVITKGERFSGLDDSGNWIMEKATGSDARKMICNPMTKVLCKFAGSASAYRTSVCGRSSRAEYAAQS